MARAFLGRGEAVSALEVLRAVPLADHPFSRFQMDVCYLLGQCYEYLGNYAAAVAAYRMIYLDQTGFPGRQAPDGAGLGPGGAEGTGTALYCAGGFGLKVISSVHGFYDGVNWNF